MDVLQRYREQFWFLQAFTEGWMAFKDLQMEMFLEPDPRGSLHGLYIFNLLHFRERVTEFHAIPRAPNPDALPDSPVQATPKKRPRSDNL